MATADIIGSDAFWKERIKRELNRLSMPDAFGDYETGPQYRHLGTAGTELSLRFEGNSRQCGVADLIHVPHKTPTRGDLSPRHGSFTPRCADRESIGPGLRPSSLAALGGGTEEKSFGLQRYQGRSLLSDRASSARSSRGGRHRPARFHSRDPLALRTTSSRLHYL
mmetsp:Transcript_83079/g.164801  ORF Transcript_83079/g.164801 Transcript_83079/m.164801 type:complete len:166 (+) Transcript_83079:90-587(+)